MVSSIEISKTFHFDAAHLLTGVPSGHKCGNLHGHTYSLTVFVCGDIGEDGMVVDYGKISDAVRPLIDKLDHSFLNDHFENPTAEVIATEAYRYVSARLAGVRAVEVKETPGTSARCDGRV